MKKIAATLLLTLSACGAAPMGPSPELTLERMTIRPAGGHTGKLCDVVGTVRNTGQRDLRYVALTVQFLDGEALVNQAKGVTDMPQLPIGGTSTFDITYTDCRLTGDHMEITAASDGMTIPVLNGVK